MIFDKKIIFFCGVLLMLFSCKNVELTDPTENPIPAPTRPYIMVLGVAQDAGYPQAGCTKDCCKDLWNDFSNHKLVSCLAVVDPASQQYWIFDATPDFKDQMTIASRTVNAKEIQLPAGIFLTHAHIGHYTGLMHLGREVIGSAGVPVYALPRMENFLINNGPWSQLVSLNNISIKPIKENQIVSLPGGIKVNAVSVPHRDEFTETAAFYIQTDEKKALFIPDIDKWEKWNRDIKEEIQKVDYAFLDGSFYENGEIPGRDMSEIPHPFLVESMELFKSLSKADKAKVHFIHFNHTNPILRKKSSVEREVKAAGFNIAAETMKYAM